MTARPAPKGPEPEALPPALQLRMHDAMLQARVLEERLIQMYKQGDGYFWIGGPGEEAFNVALGMHYRKGEGPQFDYGHFHYRQSATMLVLGMEPVDAIRQMKNTATDPFSRGRNFAGHFSARRWNVAPITSPIEVQYGIAIGTARHQRRVGGEGISIVTGGDAGTAEGDFASCLVWATRPGEELPLLIVVTHNQWGISTPAATQHGEQRIADRARAFGIPAVTIDGNDPELCYRELEKAFAYVRKERKPYFVEAMVSRLFGHSSASGANMTSTEQDCLASFEAKLDARKLRSREESDAMRAKLTAEYLHLHKQAREEPQPDPSTIHDHVFFEGTR